MLIPGPDLQGCRGRRGDSWRLQVGARVRLLRNWPACFVPRSIPPQLAARSLALWPGGAVGGSAQLRDHSHAPLTLYFIGTLSWAVSVIAAAVALSQAGARRTNGSGRSDCTTFWTSLSEGPPSRNGNRPLTPRVGSVDCWAGGPLS
jgi:hypothetical protein